MRFTGKKWIFVGILSTIAVLAIAPFTFSQAPVVPHHIDWWNAPDSPYNPYCPDPPPADWNCTPCHYNYNEDCEPSPSVPPEVHGNGCLACHSLEGIELEFPQNCIGVALPGGCFQTPDLMIQELIGTVMELNVQNGILNSLDAKLDTALSALDDVNENNDVAAINSLNAFINAVEAQRGNKITNEDADMLNAAVQAIIDKLSQ